MCPLVQIVLSLEPKGPCEDVEQRNRNNTPGNLGGTGPTLTKRVKEKREEEIKRHQNEVQCRKQTRHIETNTCRGTSYYSERRKRE